MPDANFEHPRLVAIYDALEGDRSDLDLYVALADDFGARRVLDLGCGTGALALLLAARGVEVTGVDPAAGSLRVARAKAGADRVRWVHGDAAALPPMRVDLATMTGNVAQAIVEPADWDRTLRGVHGALRPGGRLVFETRAPRVPGLARMDPRGDLPQRRGPGRRRARALGRPDRRGRSTGRLSSDVGVRLGWSRAHVGLDAALP